MKLSGTSGVEVSVWRFGFGGLTLLILCMINPTSRNLIKPLKENSYAIVILSVFGMAFGQFLFHWVLDFVSVVQVATMVTIMPIGVVFVTRVIERTRITPPKIISVIGTKLIIVGRIISYLSKTRHKLS